MTYKSEDFKYPSFEERKEAAIGYPSIRNFGFKEYSIATLFNNPHDLHIAKKEADLFYWDLCLTNKLGKLSESYINFITNFNRGVANSFAEYKESNTLNSILFNYYTETFYYFYISSRDYIGQIISVFCDLRKKDNEVDFNKLKTQITNDKIKAIILEFTDALNKTGNYRNTFTHRYPANFPDFRPKVTEEDFPLINGNKSKKRKIYQAGSGKYTKPIEFVENINESLKILETFINKLRIEFKLP